MHKIVYSGSLYPMEKNIYINEISYLYLDIYILTYIHNIFYLKVCIHTTTNLRHIITGVYSCTFRINTTQLSFVITVKKERVHIYNCTFQKKYFEQLMNTYMKIVSSYKNL